MVGIDRRFHIGKELLTLGISRRGVLAIKQRRQAEEAAGKHQMGKNVPHDGDVQQFAFGQCDTQQTGDIRRGEQVRDHVRHA